MKHSLFKRFRNNNEGTTAVEFAVVSSAFFMLMLGIMEFGLYMMTQVALEGAVTQAGRYTAIDSSNSADRATAVANLIRQKTSGLINAGSVTVSAARVADGGTIAPDLCLNGPGGAPTSSAACPSGTPYVEENGIAGYQGNGTTTVGQPGDLIEVRANYPWRVMFPFLGQFFGNNGVVLITASTVVKNEP